MGVDDSVSDYAYYLFEEVLDEICVWSDVVSLDEAREIIAEVPEELKDKWYDFLWKFDVRDFKPTKMFKEEYQYNLFSVLTERAYDLKGIVIKYINEHKQAKKE